jgi:hypothetical protein
MRVQRLIARFHSWTAVTLQLRIRVVGGNLPFEYEPARSENRVCNVASLPADVMFPRISELELILWTPHDKENYSYADAITPQTKAFLSKCFPSMYSFLIWNRQMDATGSHPQRCSSPSVRSSTLILNSTTWLFAMTTSVVGLSTGSALARKGHVLCSR